MFKIALNAGHGVYTAGKRCDKTIDPNETREWTLNSRICNKIEEKLKAYEGYEVIRCDDITGKTDVPLKDRTNKANKFKADFYLAIHHNAGIKGGSGGGIQAYVYTSVDNTTLAWQKELYNALIKHTSLKGNRSTPLPKENLHEVRETAMPAVLLELGFMDSTTDTPIILTEDFANKAATACVEVLVSKGKLTKKVVVSQPTTTKSVTTTTTATKPTNTTTTLTTGVKLNLSNVALYASSSAKTKASTKTGTYYVWSATVVNNKIRITNTTANVGKAGQITGWISVDDAKKALGITTTAKPTASTTTTTTNQTIVKGSKVKVKSGAKTYTGGKLASYVYARTYKVKEIKGDRVVITYLGITVAAVKKSDLTLVK